MARAGLASLEEKGEPVGARAWFLYPPLVVLYLGIALLLVVGPSMVGVSLSGDPGLRAVLAEWLPQPFWLGMGLAIASVAGTSWIVLGLTSARYTRAVRWVFWPFANWFERRHGLRFALVGLALATPSALVLTWLV